MYSGVYVIFEGNCEGNRDIDETGWSLEKRDTSTTSVSEFCIVPEEKDTSTMCTSMSSKIVDSEGKDASMMSMLRSMSSKTIDSEGKRSIVGVGKYPGCDSGALRLGCLRR